MVGMRPLEKSLEKLDDVMKKKLSEMNGGSTVDGSTVPSSASNPSSGRSLSSTETSDASFVRRSAVSMLSVKKPIHTADAGRQTHADEGKARRHSIVSLFDSQWSTLQMVVLREILLYVRAGDPLATMIYQD